MNILKKGRCQYHLLKRCKNHLPLCYSTFTIEQKTIWLFLQISRAQSIQRIIKKSSIPGARKPLVLNGYLVKQLNFLCKDVESSSETNYPPKKNDLRTRKSKWHSFVLNNRVKRRRSSLLLGMTRAAGAAGNISPRGKGRSKGGGSDMSGRYRRGMALAVWLHQRCS